MENPAEERESWRGCNRYRHRREAASISLKDQHMNTTQIRCLAQVAYPGAKVVTCDDPEWLEHISDPYWQWRLAAQVMAGGGKPLAIIECQRANGDVDCLLLSAPADRAAER